MLLLWEFAAATVLFCDDWRSIVFCDVLVRDCSLPWDVKGFGVFSAPLKGGRSPESGRFFNGSSPPFNGGKDSLHFFFFKVLFFFFFDFLSLFDDSDKLFVDNFCSISLPEEVLVLVFVEATGFFDCSSSRLAIDSSNSTPNSSSIR